MSQAHAVLGDEDKQKTAHNSTETETSCKPDGPSPMSKTCTEMLISISSFLSTKDKNNFASTNRIGQKAIAESFLRLESFKLEQLPLVQVLSKLLPPNTLENKNLKKLDL